MNLNTLLTPDEWQVLQAVAVRIVPATPGCAADGTAALPHVLRELEPGGGASGFLPALRELLAVSEPENHPAFRRFVELVTEGFYTSPEGMAMVGFRKVEVTV